MDLLSHLLLFINNPMVKCLLLEYWNGKNFILQTIPHFEVVFIIPKFSLLYLAYLSPDIEMYKMIDHIKLIYYDYVNIR